MPLEQLDDGLALVGAAEDGLALHVGPATRGRRGLRGGGRRGREAHQGLDAGHRVVGHLQRARPALAGQPLGLAGLDVGQQLDGLDRHAPLPGVAGHGLQEGAVGRLEAVGPEFGIQAADRLLDFRQRGPVGLDLAEPFVDLRLERLEADLAAAGLPVGELQGQAALLEPVDQLVGRQQGLLVAGFGGLGAQREGGVAVGLVGAPGVAVGVALAGDAAGDVDGVAEVGSGDGHLLEEGFGEGLAGVVADFPAGGDDAAHAHLDELAGQAVGEPVAPVAELRADLAQVAAVEEDQVGHGLHQPDLGGGEQQAVGEHHAAAVAAVGGLAAVDAVGRDDQHPAGLGEQAGEYVGRAAVGRGVGDLVAGAFENAADRVALEGGAGQVGEAVALGLPVGPAAGLPAGAAELGVEALGVRVGNDAGAQAVGAHHLAAEALGHELADDAGFFDQRFAVGLEHLPGQVGGGFVDDQDQVARLAGGGLELGGHEQLEEGVAEAELAGVGGAVGAVQGAAGEGFDEARLALLDDALGPRPLAHVDELDALGVVGGGRHVEPGGDGQLAVAHLVGVAVEAEDAAQGIPRDGDLEARGDAVGAV